MNVVEACTSTDLDNGPFQGVNRALYNGKISDFEKFLGQEILKNDPKTLSRLSGSIKTEIPMSKYPRK